MLPNGKSFYKITGEKNFEEIQLVGNRLILHRITAEQYPEMLRIRDMLEGMNGLYLESGEAVWNELLERLLR